MFQHVSTLVCAALMASGAYNSYKAIKSNDLQKLEVWLMYWVVMGTVMAMESSVEWIFAWFPFYYECKTLVILWLTLPQIQGSTYIYVAHLHPFLASHEADIDAAVADAKVRARQAGAEWLNRAVQRLRQAVTGVLAPQLFEIAPNDAPPAQIIRQPPTLADPGSGATAQLYSLAGNVLRMYGPAAVAAGSALLHPMNGLSVRDPATSSSSSSTDGMRRLSIADRGRPSSANTPSSMAGLEFPDGRDSFTSGRASMTKAQSRIRRAELEAQLAEIEAASSMSSSSSRSSTSAPYKAYHPRSVSAGPYPSATTDPRGVYVPRDPVAARVERSFVGGYGFEEIGRDEIQDFPPITAKAMVPPSPGGTSRGGSWWWWGGQGTETGNIDVGSERKDKDA